MIIDRSKFLTLAASLATAAAAAACSGGSDASSDEGTGDTAGALANGNHAAPQCYWDPAKEGTGRATQEYFAGDIGFDPVNNFSAAEGFCFRATGLDRASDADFMSVQQLYLKCSSYAKLYVPQSVYWAYQKMHREQRVTWESLYAIDHDIDRESGYCSTDAAKRACATAAEKEECVRRDAAQAREDLRAHQVPPELTARAEGRALQLRAEGGFNTFQ
ncbi:MAG: hypothetical protein U0235_12905 [Polyangiaceae bacterium]